MLNYILYICYNKLEVIMWANNKKDFEDKKLVFVASMKNGNDEKLYNLHPKSKTILTMYFVENKTLKDIGEHFGITAERIRQLIVKYIRLLKYYNNKLEKN